MKTAGRIIIAPTDMDPAELERLREDLAARYGKHGPCSVVVLSGAETKTRWPILATLAITCGWIVGVSLAFYGLPFLGFLVAVIGVIIGVVWPTR